MSNLPVGVKFALKVIGFCAAVLAVFLLLVWLV